jgi:hypothetical protein
MDVKKYNTSNNHANIRKKFKQRNGDRRPETINIPSTLNLLKYGTIDDEAQKFFGPILVLNYGNGERKMKVEISNRQYENHYEVKSFMGINMLVMTLPDMFAHKQTIQLPRIGKLRQIENVQMHS